MSGTILQTYYCKPAILMMIFQKIQMWTKPLKINWKQKTRTMPMLLPKTKWKSKLKTKTMP